MKRSTLFFSLSCLASLLAIASCSGLADVSGQGDSALAYISLDKGASRTLLPVDDNTISLLENFTLTGTFSDGSAQTFAEGLSYEELSESAFAISSFGIWNFRLSAEKSGLSYAGTAANVNIRQAARVALSFKMSRVAQAGGTGAFELSLSLSDSVLSAAGAITAALYDDSGESLVLGFEEAPLSVSGNSAVYEGNGVAAGNYMCKVRFYSDSNREYLMSVYPVGIVVESNLTSRGTESISKIAERYAITYRLNHGTNSPDNPDFFEPGGGAIALKAPSRQNCYFDGWYASSDYSGDAITEIPAGTKSSVKLYAKWDDPIGSVILKDGSRVKYRDVANYNFTDANPAVAVIAFRGGYVWGDDNPTKAGQDGVWYGVGVVQGHGLAWAYDLNAGKWWYEQDRDGVNINFKKIRLYETSKGEVSYEGDTDGSDNWAAICEQDIWNTDSDERIAAAYPLFHWMLHYAQTAGLVGSAFESGWYIPSATELLSISMASYEKDEEEADPAQEPDNGWHFVNSSIADYVDRIDEVLELIGSEKFTDGDLWSSSQYPGSSEDECDAAYEATLAQYYDILENGPPESNATSSDEIVINVRDASQFGNAWGIAGGSGGKQSEGDAVAIRPFDIENMPCVK